MYVIDIESPGRIGAVHFKDFATMEPGVDTVTLGDGVALLDDGAAWIKANLPDAVWMIAEQDKVTMATSDMASKNAAFLKARFSE